jgi:PAS domain S-box-containing protein
MMGYPGKAKWIARPAACVALRYGLALVSVAAAFGLAHASLYFHLPQPFTALALSAIAIAFWYGGTNPGILAALLSLLVRDYFFEPEINAVSRVLYSLVFLIFALVMIRVTRARYELELRVAERTAELTGANKDLKLEIAVRKRAEKELRLAIDTIPALVWTTLPDGSLDFINRRWAEIGLSLNDLRGSKWSAVMHPDERAAVVDKWRTAVETGTPYENVRRVRRADGEYRWFLSRGALLRDESGKIIKWYGVETDIEDQRRAEDAVRRSEAYLTQAQRLSRTGSFGWRPSTGEIFWSEETFRIFQYDRTTKPTVEIILQRVHPEDATEVKQTIERASQDGKHFEHEYRLVMPDGSVKHAHVVAHALSDESGSLEFVGAVMDVTEQHQARAALEKAFDDIQKSEERLRLTLDTIPSTVVSSLPDGSIDFINQRWVEYHGLTLEDLRREGLEAVYHPEDRKRNMDRRRAAIAAGTPFEYEARLRRADGVYRWQLVHNVPLRDEVGNIVKWYGTSIDIEDRKRAEEAQRESEQRFRDYAETASDWFWETGRDHRFTRVWQHLDSTGGEPPSRIGLTRWDYATDVESRPEEWGLYRATLDAHQPFRDFVYSAIRRDGSTVYLRTSGKPFFDAKGDFLGYRGVAADVTAAVRADQAEEALRNVQAELAHVTRVTTLGELTASIAHEVNQPLAAIVTNGGACLRWLARDVPDLDEVRAAVERMINDGNRAAEVIQRVRALAKKTDAPKMPLPINGVIEEVLLLLQPEVLSHQALLRLELASELPLLLADRIQLQQVIINLVINGMEAMTPVTDRPRELKILSQREADQVLVAVQDSGVGIDPEHVDRLFNSFFTTKPSGMGMGLSICRSIIEAHGGKLWASCNIGAGATFQFTLPAYHKHAS